MDVVCASEQSDLEAAIGQRPTTQTTRLWDRKAEGGFPGTSLEDLSYPVRRSHELNAQWFSPFQSRIFFGWFFYKPERQAFTF